ncbi:MAG: hypothetical protein Q7S63_02620 [bacterium]|nr:hypothetical protein [bacterium]
MPIALVADYLVWHFIQAPKEILGAWYRVCSYSFTYFSTPVLVQTLFSPWRRSEWGYPRIFDLGKFLETFFSNIISRILGAIMRIFMIFFGILGELCVFFAGMLVFILWLLAPFLVVGGFFYGFTLLF